MRPVCARVPSASSVDIIGECIAVVNEKLSLIGRHFRDVRRLGSCFYEAANLVLQELGRSPATTGVDGLAAAARRDRLAIVTMMREHLNTTFNGMTLGEWLTLAQRPGTRDPFGSADAYLQYMAGEGGWADVFAIGCWQAHFQVRLQGWTS